MKRLGESIFSFSSLFVFGISCLAALALPTGCQSFSEINVERIYAPENIPDSEQMKFVASMGLGINIGNTLDCIMDFGKMGISNGHVDESSWGNPRITKEYIAALKNYGYKTIRLPVTWAQHQKTSGDYLIDEAWISRVAEVTDWCLEQGLFVIVNLHHDGGTSEASWILDAASDYNSVAKRFSNVWKQIAERLSDRSDHLIFEAMNEVGFDSASKPYKVLNDLNQLFVDTVRTTGGNNSTRYLIFSGYYTDIEKTCNARFKVPTDTAQNRLLLSIHYYTPSAFTISEDSSNQYWYQYSWGSYADIMEMNNLFKKLNEKFTLNGIPVVMGEYGIVQKKDSRSRSMWYAAVMKACLNFNICPVLWDTGNEISRYAPFEMKRDLAKAMNIMLKNGEDIEK